MKKLTFLFILIFAGICAGKAWAQEPKSKIRYHLPSQHRIYKAPQEKEKKFSVGLNLMPPEQTTYKKRLGPNIRLNFGF